MAQRLETASARLARATIVLCLAAGAAIAQADGKSALPRTPVDLDESFLESSGAEERRHRVARSAGAY